MKTSTRGSRALRAIIVVACAAAAFVYAGARDHEEFAYGCDAFGYLRQAELFRDHGPIGGLDTRIGGPEAQFLVALAKSSGLEEAQWREMVAPHCHHYVKAVDSVVLQYPPGTGLALSLFPRGRAAQSLYLCGLAAAILAFALAAARGPMLSVAGAAWLTALVLLARAFRDAWVMRSYSVALSLGLAALVALLALRALPPRRAPRALECALLGAACGLLLLARLANLAIVAGVALFALLRLFAAPSRRAFAPGLVLAGAGFLLAGALPELYANHINAGSALATAYGPADAAPPVLSLTLVRDNAFFYFARTFGWPLAVAAVAAVAWLLAATRLERERAVRRELLPAAAAGAVVLALSVGYFLTHAIRIPYYLLPACASVCCFACFAQLQAGADRAAGAGDARAAAAGSALAAIVLAGLCSGAMLRIQPTAIAPPLPAPAADPRAVVWADMTSGTLLYYNDRYAGKLNFGAPCARRRLLAAADGAGRTQYFVRDSEAMASVMAQLEDAADFEPVGEYGIDPPAGVYRLRLRDAAALACEAGAPGAR